MVDKFRTLRIVLTMVTFMGFTFYIVSFALPKWSKYDSGNAGLWQMCFMNGGAESCAVWPDSHKTILLQLVQALSCCGLISYFLCVVFGAMTLCWTRQWKAVRAMKYATGILSGLAAVFVTVAVAIYKTEKGSNIFTVAYGWYFALVGAVMACIASPFYFCDGYYTVAQKKVDRQQFFRNSNIPPKPTLGIFERHRAKLKLAYGGGLPPLLSKFRKQQNKAMDTKQTSTETKSFPIHNSKTNLNLLNQSETKSHPSTQNIQVTTVSDNKSEIQNDNSAISQITSQDVNHDITENYIKGKDIFLFHKSETIHTGGKTLLKIHNKSETLPPLKIVTTDIENIVDERISRMPIQHSGSQWEQEQARRKFAPYFTDVRNNDEGKETFLTQCKTLIKKDNGDSKTGKDKNNTSEEIHLKDGKHKLNNRKSDTSMTTYPRDDSVRAQDGLIHNVPPSQINLNLLDKSETKSHPVNQNLQVITVTNKQDSQNENSGNFEITSEFEPTKPKNKILTSKEESNPLPPSKPNLNLLDKYEMKIHPALQNLQVTTVTDNKLQSQKDNSVNFQITSPEVDNDIEEIDIKDQTTFKFHKTLTIHSEGKTVLKIHNKSEKLPPLKIVATDIENIFYERTGRMPIQRSGSQWDEEQARRKFAPYFTDIVNNNDSGNGIYLTQFKTLIKKDTEDSGIAEDRIKDAYSIYGDKSTKEKFQIKKNKHKLKTIKSNSSVTTYPRDDRFHAQDGLLIHNESISLSPSKTNLNLSDKSETKSQPAPENMQVTMVTDNKFKSQNENSANFQITSQEVDNGIEKIVIKDQTIFRFHKPETVHTGEKELLKIGSKNEKQKPIKVVTTDIENIVDERLGRMPIQHSGSQWEQEQARRKFAPYFTDVRNNDEGKDTFLTQCKTLIKKDNGDSKTMNDRINDTSSIYGDTNTKREIQIKHSKHKLKISPSKTNLNPLDKSETKKHPAPNNMQVTTVTDNKLESKNENSTNSQITSPEVDNDIEEIDTNETIMLQIHKTEIIHTGGKTLLKNQSKNKKHKPFTVVKTDIANIVDEKNGRIPIQHSVTMGKRAI